MVLFKLVTRNQYHKNGTQFIGKMFARIIGEKNYEYLRIQRRINYAHFWYFKQKVLYKFQQQWPSVANWFSLLNKANTSAGFPAKRAYERYQDFAVYNMNHEGWFQMYFVVAGIAVILWNWWLIGVYWPVRGENVNDQDLFRYRDARVSTNFDRTKYKYNYYFFGAHYNASVRRAGDDKDHPDNPRFNWTPQFNNRVPYGLDRYIKYYGYDNDMRNI